MKPAGTPAFGARRAGALLALALLIVTPIFWVGWSVNAASLATETISGQSTMLAKLRERAASLAAQNAADPDAPDPASVFLPGETPAIAGAALQRIVADAVEAAGGRVIETEFARVEAAEENPGRIDLRVSFEAEVVSLQRILFELERGLPILLVHSVDIQSETEATEAPSPPLRVLMLVGGNWEAPA